MKWPFERMAILFGTLLVGGLGLFYWNDLRFSDETRESGLERCLKSYDGAMCNVMLDMHHDACFRKTQKGGGKTSQRYIDAREYDFCLKHGVDAMRAKRAEWAKRTNTRESLMNPADLVGHP